MKNESRKSSKKILTMVAVCLAVGIVSFTAGMFFGTYSKEGKLNNEKSGELETKVEEVAKKENNDIFMEGVLAGMDYMSLGMMYACDAISEEEYESLSEVLMEYISNPTEENSDKWHEVFKEKMLAENSELFDSIK